MTDVPADFVEIEPPEQGESKTRLLRTFIGPMPPLVFTVTASGKVAGPEIKAQTEQADDETVLVPTTREGHLSRIPRSWIEDMGFSYLDKTVREIQFKHRAERIGRFNQIYKLYKDMKAGRLEPAPPAKMIDCQECSRPIRDDRFYLHELMHDLKREEEERLEYATILDGLAK